MSSLVRAAVVAAALTVCCSSVHAQDTAAPAATAEDWPELIKEHNAKILRLREIQGQLQTADATQAAQLQKEVNDILKDAYDVLFPRMRAAAVELLKQDAVEAETLVDIARLSFRTYQENKFSEALELAEGVIAKAPTSDIAVNVAGVCHFALQDFQEAADILTSAQQNGLLIDQLGGNYLESATKYVEYWKDEQARREKDANAAEPLPQVELDTSRGKIVVELFEDDAPNTVANFINLVESGFYDGTTFHRVLAAFMAQGGDPNTKPGGAGTAGTGGPGYTIKCEWDLPTARRHFAGSLSMAHTADRDTGGSQFFLTHLPTPHLDPEVAEAGGGFAHTVFGRVVEGMDVVLAIKVDDTLTAARVLNKRGHEYKPETTPEPQQ